MGRVADHPPGPQGGAPPPPLHARIGYDLRLESAALSRLDEGDPRGCRLSFSQLLRRLDFAELDGAALPAVQLLLDTLQKVNRRIHRAQPDEALYQKSRMELIDRFAACRSAEAARQRFMPALTRLLARYEPDSRPLHPLVARARKLIDRSYTRRTSLSIVAASLAVSPNYLSRLFRAETGVTLTAYVQRARLDRAKQLLAQSGSTISEIAYQVGYQNYRDFYRNFVKYEKASPRQMRRRLSQPPRS